MLIVLSVTPFAVAPPLDPENRATHGGAYRDGTLIRSVPVSQLGPKSISRPLALASSSVTVPACTAADPTPPLPAPAFDASTEAPSVGSAAPAPWIPDAPSTGVGTVAGSESGSRKAISVMAVSVNTSGWYRRSTARRRSIPPLLSYSAALDVLPGYAPVHFRLPRQPEDTLAHLRAQDLRRPTFDGVRPRAQECVCTILCGRVALVPRDGGRTVHVHEPVRPPLVELGVVDLRDRALRARLLAAETRRIRAELRDLLDFLLDIGLRDVLTVHRVAAVRNRIDEQRPRVFARAAHERGGIEGEPRQRDPLVHQRGSGNAPAVAFRADDVLGRDANVGEVP